MPWSPSRTLRKPLSLWCLPSKMGLDDVAHTIDLWFSFHRWILPLMVPPAMPCSCPSLLSPVLRDPSLALMPESRPFFPFFCAVPNVVPDRALRYCCLSFLIKSFNVSCFTIDPFLGAVDIIDRAPYQAKLDRPRVQHVCQIVVNSAVTSCPRRRGTEDMAARLDLISDKMTDLLPNRPRTCGESLKEARGHARISLY